MHFIYQNKPHVKFSNAQLNFISKYLHIYIGNNHNVLYQKHISRVKRNIPQFHKLYKWAQERKSYVLVINTIIKRVKNHVHSNHRESPQGVRQIPLQHIKVKARHSHHRESPQSEGSVTSKVFLHRYRTNRTIRIHRGKLSTKDCTRPQEVVHQGRSLVRW